MSAIIKETKNNILYITLNRPDVLNAFSTEMLMELQSAFKEAESDEIRCVVLTGSGKGFCSGQDLKDYEEGNKTFKQLLEEKYNPLIRQIMNLPKPVICGINGVAAGAGLSLVLACDYRIAVESAMLIEIFINIGLVPDSGSIFTLPRMLGLPKAFQMCSSGERVSARDALEMGLVNAVVWDNSVLKTALEKYAKKFSSMPTKAVGMIKQMLNKSFSSDLNTILDLEAEMQNVAGNSEDYREGVNSFLEKRKPAFKGK